MDHLTAEIMNIKSEVSVLELGDFKNLTQIMESSKYNHDLILL